MFSEGVHDGLLFDVGLFCHGSDLSFFGGLPFGAAGSGLGFAFFLQLFVLGLIGEDGFGFLCCARDGGGTFVGGVLFEGRGTGDDGFVLAFAVDVVFDGHSHGGGGFGGGSDGEFDASGFESGMGGSTESGDGYLFVGQVGKALKKGAHPDGREEADDIVVLEVELFEVARYGGVHRGFGVFELCLVEHFGVLGLLFVGAGEEEFLIAVFGKNLNEVGKVLVAKKDFAFAVLDVVLEVVGDGFGRAEVFHGVGDDFAKFFCQSEEMVD